MDTVGAHGTQEMLWGSADPGNQGSFMSQEDLMEPRRHGEAMNFLGTKALM